MAPVAKLQLVAGNGDFNESGLEDFMQASQLARCGQQYAVVSIMGPQSSGTFTCTASSTLQHSAFSAACRA